MAKIAPLSGGFMLTSVVGFAAAYFFIYDISASWGMTFMIFFVIMFVASIISMTHAPMPEHKHRNKKVYE